MDDIYRTNVCGVDISLRTTESTAYTDEIVEEVRRRVRAVMQSGTSVHKASIVTNLILCDELRKARDEADDLRVRADDLERELARLRKQGR